MACVYLYAVQLTGVRHSAKTPDLFKVVIYLKGIIFLPISPKASVHCVCINRAFKSVSQVAAID